MGIVIAFLMAFSIFTTSVDDAPVTTNTDPTTTVGSNNIGGEDWGGM